MELGEATWNRSVDSPQSIWAHYLHVVPHENRKAKFKKALAAKDMDAAINQECKIGDTEEPVELQLLQFLFVVLLCLLHCFLTICSVSCFSEVSPSWSFARLVSHTHTHFQDKIGKRNMFCFRSPRSES